MVLTTDLVFFLLMSQTLAAASSFSSSRTYSSLSFLPPLFLCLGPYSDYVEVNISLNDFSALSLLNVYAPSIGSSPKDSRTNFFFLSIFLSYVEAEAVEFSRFRFRFHRKSTASASTSLVQGAARRKKGLCEGSARSNWDSREDQQPFQSNPNRVWDRTTTLRRLLISAVQFCLLYMYRYIGYYLYIQQKFRTSLSKKIGVNTCFAAYRRSVIMIRVNVNSKSELIDDREEKSALYGVICCCDHRLLPRAVICGHTV